MLKKFRLLDIKEKKLIYPDWSYGEDMGENTSLIVSYIAGEMHGVSDEFQESFVLQQYTGIVDKNNVEVYEGDKIKVISKIDVDGYFETKDLDVDGIFEVFYNDETASFELELIENSHKDFIGYPLIQEWSEEFEVIGFVENPIKP